MSLKRTHPRQNDPNAAVGLRSDFRVNTDQAAKVCAWSGCQACADYKAPAGRQDLRDYIWLCLDHVRAYNQRWDYFTGMSADEIEEHRRADVTWHRPTWQFGTSAGGGEKQWHDPFQFFEDGVGPQARQNEPPQDAKTLEMIRILELKQGFSETDLKAQYKVLAKRHHPDLHGGDRASEEMLKRVNEAYAHLRRQFV